MAYKRKEDQAKAAKRHYEKNKATIKRRAYLFMQKARKRNRDFIENHFLTHPCVDCGFNDPRALDFDHVRGEKEGNVSNMVCGGFSIKRIQAEIDKCEVRCANCHRIRTHETIWS